MSKMSRCLNAFKNLDMFGIPIQLNFNKRHKFRSNFGAFLSLLVLGVSFYFLITQIAGWFSIEVSTTIYSNESFSVSGIVKENRTISYTLTGKNYSIYFAVYAVLPNSTLSHKDLEKYFTIGYEYSDTGIISEKKRTFL